MSVTAKYGFVKVPLSSMNYPTLMDQFMDDVDSKIAKWVDAANYATIKAAVTAIGAAEVTLVVITAINASNAAEAVTIPANVSVFPMRPGVISKGTATLLTINGPVVGDPKHPWLSGFAAGEVTFGGNVSEVRSSWVGTDETAVNVLKSALTTGGVIKKNVGIEDINAGITINQPSLTLEGSGTTTLAGTTGTIIRKAANIATGISSAADLVKLKKFKLDCNNKTGDGILIQNSECQIEDIAVVNVGGTGYAIKLDQATLSYLKKIKIKESYKGIYIGGTTGSELVVIEGLSYDIDTPTSQSDAFTIENSTGGLFKGMNLSTATGGKSILVNGNCTDLQFIGVYVENTLVNTVDSIVLTGSGNKNIAFDGLYVNHGANNLRNMISTASGVHGLHISNAHFLTTAVSAITCVYIADVTEAFLRNITSVGSVAYSLLDCNNTPTYTSGINIDGHTSLGAANAQIRLYGFNHSIKNCKKTTVLLNGGTVHDVTVENMDSDCNIEIGASAYDITLINCKGTITIASGATGIVCINCTGSIGGAGAGVAIKINNQQPANADTSGATLGQLETEVNELKATLRTFGLIAT